MSNTGAGQGVSGAVGTWWGLAEEVTFRMGLEEGTETQEWGDRDLG